MVTEETEKEDRMLRKRNLMNKLLLIFAKKWTKFPSTLHRVGVLDTPGIEYTTQKHQKYKMM